MKDRTLLQAVSVAAATQRRVTRERDEAILAAWRAGWSLNEIARVGQLTKYVTRGVVQRMLLKESVSH